MNPFRILSAIRNRASDERGWVLVIAVALMTIMLGVGLALLAGVDTQGKESGRERVRESSFNLAEGLAEAESVVLQNNWPTDPPCTGNAIGCGYQPQCTHANAGTNPNQCPTPTALVGTAAAFNNIDQRTGATWSIQVRDDIDQPVGGGLPTYVAGTGTPGVDRPECGPTGAKVVCTWDNNGNKQVWVRVDAVTKEGKRRSIVALLKLENFNVSFASNAVTGGAVNFSNAGNKTIVDAGQSKVVVRCQPAGYTHLTADFFGTPTASVTPGTGTFFQNHDVVAIDEGSSTSYELLEVQSSTANTVTFYSSATKNHLNGAVFSPAPNPGSNSCETWTSPKAPTQNGSTKAQLNREFSYMADPDYAPAMTAGQLRAVERGARVFTNTCPTNWTGRIVIRVAPLGGCEIPSGTYNNPPNYGLIIVENQAPATPSCAGKNSGPALTLKGGATFFGLIYMVNQQCADFGDLPVLNINGNAQVKGAIAVDGHGRVSIGQASGSSNCTISGANGDCPTLVFDPNAVAQASAAGAAGLVQNTWRELAPGQ